VDEPITLVLRGAAHVGALTRGANLIDLPATVPTTPISYLADMYSFGTPRKVVCDPYQGRALVLGFFDSVDLYQRPHAALLNADGSLNTQWSLANYGYLNSDYYTYPGSPFSAAFDSDGSMVVSFGRPVGIGNTLYSMVRFSGSNMDPVLGWVPGIAPDQTINDIAIDASHRVYVAQPDGVRRLNGTNGNTDGWFAAQQVSGGAQKLQIASTRQLVYALEGPYGIFQQRVNAFSMGSGAQVGPLFPPADGGIPFDDIEDFALDPSGYIYVAGHYLGGGEGRYLAKMSPAGNLVTSWVGASTSFGYGAFTRFALAPMGSHWLNAANAGNSELGRYDMSNPGTRDGTFAPSTNSHSYYSGSIASMCETKDHRLLAAGDFYYVAGNSREGVVAFTDSDPLLNDRIFYHQF
jgi:hypothetical protein